MGSSTSKPESKVYTPTTPIDFSASFLSQLENSAESDYTRAQYTEKYIQDRVASELTKLEKKTLQQFKNTTEEAIIKEDKPGLSVHLSNEKINKLTKLLQENIELSKVEVNSEIKTARSKVIQCLSENKGRSLNCWEEVEQFKQLVKDL